MTILISDTNHDDKKNTIDTLTLLLQIHFLQMHDILAKIHVRNQNQKNVEGARSSFAIINELTWRALEILQRFPDTEVYLSIWRDGLNFSSIKGYLDDTIHNMPETVQ